MYQKIIVMRVTQYNDLIWSTPATEKTVYKSFAATRLQEPPSGSIERTVVLPSGKIVTERYKSVAQMKRAIRK